MDIQWRSHLLQEFRGSRHISQSEGAKESRHPVLIIEMCEGEKELLEFQISQAMPNSMSRMGSHEQDSLEGGAACIVRGTKERRNN